MTRVSTLFDTEQDRNGSRGIPHPHTTPLGGVGVVGKDHPLAPTSDRAAWVREHLPTCAAVAAAFKAEFGDVRLAYASQNGHTIGTPSPSGVSLAETLVGPLALPKKAGAK